MSRPSPFAPRDIETVDRGPRRVARRIRIDADAADLFAILANPHRHHEADGSGTVMADVIGPRELQLGDRFRVRMRMFGIPYAMTSTVTEIVPNRVVQWQLPGKHQWRWEFEPQADGSTLVTEVFDYSTSPMPRVLERLRAVQRNTAGIEASLAKLARHRRH